jgi:hypothetical protein
MGLRLQRRYRVSKGLGLNVSGSGVSLSKRGKLGSIGTSGYSIRTGVKGLSYRGRWGKSAGDVGVIVGLVFLSFYIVELCFNLIFVIVKLIFWLLTLPFRVLKLIMVTAYRITRRLFGHKRLGG